MLYFVPVYYNMNRITTSYTILDSLPLYQDLFLIYALIFYLIPTFLIQRFIYYYVRKKYSNSQQYI